jgi:hypothetical protein
MGSRNHLYLFQDMLIHSKRKAYGMLFQVAEWFVAFFLQRYCKCKSFTWTDYIVLLITKRNSTGLLATWTGLKSAHSILCSHFARAVSCWPHSYNEHHNFRSSVVGWGAMLQAGRSRGRVPMRWIFFNWPNPSGRNMVLGSTQRLTEMSTRNLPGG